MQPRSLYLLKNILPLLFLLTGYTAFAQYDMEDVIYLKSGSVIRGKMLPAQPEALNKTRIELLGGSVFVFEQTEIDSIKKEDGRKARLARMKKDYYRKDRGYRNMTQLGLIYGVNLKNEDDPYYYYYNNDRDDLGLSIQTVNGYQFWPYLYVGGGIGIDRFSTYKQTFSPFFVRIASEFIKRKVTPYVFIDGGYSVMWRQRNNDWQSFENKGGAYSSAGGGIRIYTRSRASVILSVAYRMNMSESKWWYTNDETGTYYTTKRTYQRMVVSAGVTF